MTKPYKIFLVATFAMFLLFTILLAVVAIDMVESACGTPGDIPCPIEGYPGPTPTIDPYPGPGEAYPGPIVNRHSETKIYIPIIGR